MRSLRPPDVLLIGVPRAGTTSLYHGLAQHPRIFGSERKETCFTCPDLDPGTRRGDTMWIQTADDYLALFAAAQPGQLIIEGCTYNLYSAPAIERIRSLNADARFLVQLRDPVDLMASNHALKIIMLDTVNDDFAHAVAIQDSRRDRPAWAEPPPNMASYDLRDKATVSFGLSRFVAAFGSERVHITLFDEFARDQAAVFASTFEFLGLDPQFRPSVGALIPNRVARFGALNRAMGSSGFVSTAKRVVPRRLHAAARNAASRTFRLNRRVAARPPLNPELRDRLRSDFAPEVARLSELAGMDLAARWWSSPEPSEPAPRPDSSG